MLNFHSQELPSRKTEIDLSHTHVSIWSETKNYNYD